MTVCRQALSHFFIQNKQAGALSDDSSDLQESFPTVVTDQARQCEDSLAYHPFKLKEPDKFVRIQRGTNSAVMHRHAYIY